MNCTVNNRAGILLLVKLAGETNVRSDLGCMMYDLGFTMYDEPTFSGLPGLQRLALNPQ